jgi:hypothetical protein
MNRMAKQVYLAAALPNFTASIAFVKSGHDGVDIESQRGAESARTYVAFDSSSPYIDNRPPATAGRAEQRRYRLRYRDNDIHVGVFSNTVMVTVGRSNDERNIAARRMRRRFPIDLNGSSNASRNQPA